MEPFELEARESIRDLVARYNASGGNFYSLSALSDGQWQEMAEMIRAANDKDKAQRSV